MYSDSKYVQQVNDRRFKNQNRELSYTVSAKTLYNNFPILEVGLKQSFGSYSLSESLVNFTRNELFANIDYDFWKGYILSLNFISNNFRNNSLNQENNFDLANASLYYRKENSAWSFELNIKNLFDVPDRSSYYFSEYIISDTRTFILPRIFMISIGYNL